MRLLWLVVIFLLILVSPVMAVEFYVAPNGSDSSPGTKARPFATLDGAKDTVRNWKQSGREEAVTVWMRRGVYRISRPVTFTPQDSGTDRCPVTYRSYAGEKVVISGGKVVTNWHKSDKHIWVATVPWVKEQPEPFYQLFVNGIRRPRARTPNEGKYFYTKRLHYGSKAEDAALCTGMTFVKGDLKPWDNSEDALICLFHNWVNSYDRVATADWEKQKLTFARYAGVFFLGPNVRYYIENLRSALDAPGEWYLDHKAGLLYYYPIPGEDIKKSEVVAPAIKQTLINIQGTPEKGEYVENLKFVGISFQHSDADLSPNYRHSVQGADTQRGAIVAKGAKNCTIEGCEFTHLGESAISLLQGCSYNTITRCHIHDMGAGGIYLSEGVPPAAEDWYYTSHNKVDNNYIHDGGRIFRAGCGVFMAGSANYNQVTHNEISNLSWIGIHMGWSWSGKDPAYTNHNEIAYNHIHNIGNGVLNDLGGIYTLGILTGSVLHHNLIHDISRFERGTEGYGGWGIYLDAGSSELRIENNIVYNTRDGGLHLHCYSYPYGDEVINNIFAYSTSPQLNRNAIFEPDTYHAHLEHNIVYNSNSGMLYGSNWDKNSKFSSDKNCFFSEKTKSPDFNGMTFAQWQATGRDTNSIVADPGFVDAKHHDFRLKPNSPAIKLGIKPIDMSKVGLYGPASWTKLPKKYPDRIYEKAVLPKVKNPGTISCDFEEYEPGDVPVNGVATDGPTSVSVTDQNPFSGKLCLKFIDGPVQESWKPHWYETRIPGKGKVHLEASIRNDVNNPILFDLEFRDWPGMTSKYAVGPLVRFCPDGIVKAADGENFKEIGKYKLGEWLTVYVDLIEGKGRPNSYSVTLKQSSTTVNGLKFNNEAFTSFTWIGLVGMENNPGVFYADNIKVKPQH